MRAMCISLAFATLALFRGRNRRANSGSSPNARIEILEQRIAPATFTVTNTADSGDGSLRQAILDANLATGLDSIVFNIPGGGVKTIAPTSPLPDVTDQVVIDGYTQPGAQPNTLSVGNDAILLIEISGQNAGAANGLLIAGGGSTVRGLVVNAFSQDGITVTGGDSNHIEGNFIGTNAGGTAARGNGAMGVYVDSGSNTIGGTSPAQRNLISGNTDAGVMLVGSSAASNSVIGNYIGTNAGGTAALSNGGTGVVISDAPSNFVGGTTPGSGNVISGNRGGEVVIGQAGASANQVQGNFIGVNAAGTRAIPGMGEGVFIYDGATGNTIGGVAGTARNVISGTGTFGGVHIQGSQTSGNNVQGNYIGTDVNGVVAIPNGVGVHLEAPGNTIGGPAPGAANLISGNNFEGVLVISFEGSDASGNVIQGNLIGTNLTGTAALANGGYGVFVAGPNTGGNIIGGSTAGAGNLISGNDGGIRLSQTNGTLIKGNRIGVNATGTAAVMNTGSGIGFQDCADIVIGGSGLGDGNLISGNETSGIDIEDSVRTIIQGNIIGLDASGTVAIANRDHGIQLTDTSSASVIGGINPGEGNVISGNGKLGIRLEGDTFGNSIRGNAIYGNGGLAVDLLTTKGKAGVSLNDLGDGDAGANGLQNFPVISSITDGSVTTIRGTLNSTANATFSVDFYSSTVPDRGGFGGSQIYLGSATVTTDATGSASFSFSPGEVVPLGTYITATATNAANETSEFSGQFRILNGAADVTVSSNNKTVTLIEPDGDKITVKTSKGSFSPGSFTFNEDGKLQIDLGSDTQFNNANMTITAKSVGKGPGDRQADVDMINARDLNLGKVMIRGDLGHIDAGLGNSVKAAVKSLSVMNLGTDPTLDDSTVSTFMGALPKLAVKADVQNTAVQVLGRLGKVTIGGSLYGDANAGAGLLLTLETFGTFSRGVAGGIPVGAFNAGSVGTFMVKHDMAGGSVQSGGDISAVQVNGNVNGGGVAADGQIKVAKFLRNVGSDDPATPFVFAALAKVGSTKPAGAVAIDSLLVRGDVDNAQILLGFGKPQANARVLAAPRNPDASAGKIVVNGDWTASSLVAGVLDATGDGFGQNDTLIPGDNTPKIEARIAKIVIKGTATGSAAPGDSYAITAQQIGSLTIHGEKVPLTKDGKDNVLLDETNGDFRVVEL